MAQINQAAFVTSFARYNPGAVAARPEIAIVGKSNVGKSSLINMLTGNAKLARTSGTPGKTRLINYFLINNSYHLVDLPGYGFAKASKQEQQRWGEMIEGYLRTSPNLVHVLLLVDIRHKPGANDVTMVQWLRGFQVPFTVVATKADKVSRAQQHRLLMDIAFVLKLDMLRDIIVTSADKRTGKQQLVDVMQGIVDEALREDTPQTLL
nr:ribosome biogenesis GTP-binding protein YihA/YsxC [Maliibacterium massiliense]